MAENFIKLIFSHGGNFTLLLVNKKTYSGKRFLKKTTYFIRKKTYQKLYKIMRVIF